ncbi:MAG: HAMP domain-containing protein [Polyangiaceae bacterium]|nr:HAMP domain-containing protein [Polyangiaceae bacterium]
MTWSLKNKLYASFGAVIVVVAILGAVVFGRMQEDARLSSEQDRLQHAALDAQTMLTHLIQLRRHEKDFFARSDEKYETLHEDQTRELRQVATRLQSKLKADDADLRQRLDTVSAAFDKYHAGFQAAVTAHKKRGDAETGLQSEFRKAAQDAEQIAIAEHDDKLTVLILQIRRNEKNYLLRSNQQYVDAVHTLLSQAREHAIAASTAPAEEPKPQESKAKGKEGDTAPEAPAAKPAPRIRPESATRVVAALDQYLAKFDAAVDAMKELVRLDGELHTQTSAIEESLEGLVERAARTADEASAASEAVARSSEVLVAVFFGGALILAFIVARTMSGQIMRAVGELSTGTRTIAAGDLRTRVAVKTGDELGELGTSFNQMAGSLQEMTGNIATATTSIEQMVAELQATVSEQAAALQQQAASVSETVTTATHLSRSSEQVSDVARRVLDEASRSVDASARGLEAIRQSVQGMNDVREQVQNIAATILELSEKTQQIGTIISTVDDFAERSSLLALNASIEAARAGEAGKAFSVVAGEVKSLAEQSQQATERVRSILSDIQRTTHTAVMVTEEGNKRVDRGVELATGAGEIMATLSGAITSSAESAKQIAAAARQQSNGIEQISTAMAGIEQFSRQNVQATKQTETAAHTLASVSKQLKSATAHYQR